MCQAATTLGYVNMISLRLTNYLGRDISVDRLKINIFKVFIVYKAISSSYNIMWDRKYYLHFTDEEIIYWRM